MQDYNYSKWELEDLYRNRDIVTHRITELESVLIELYKVSKNVQDLLIRVDHRLLMDSDFGRAITVLSSDLGDNVLRLKFINDEIAKKNSVIIGDGCTPIYYDMNGYRIDPPYVAYPFQSPLDTAGKPMSQREEFYKDPLVNISFCGGHDSVDIDHSNGCSSIVNPETKD